MSQPKKILLVDDDPVIHDLVREAVQNIRLLSAYSCAEAKKLFQEIPPDIIAMDGNLGHGVTETKELVRLFRATFLGTMIAISSDPDNNKDLVQAGCSYAIEKQDVFHELRRLTAA